MDGVGAFDLMSRPAMLEGLHSLQEGRASSLSFHAPILWRSVFLFVGGWCRHDTHSDAGRGGSKWSSAVWLLRCYQENACLRCVFVVCAPERVSFLHSRLRAASVGLRPHSYPRREDSVVESSRGGASCQHFTVEAHRCCVEGR